VSERVNKLYVSFVVLSMKLVFLPFRRYIGVCCPDSILAIKSGRAQLDDLAGMLPAIASLYHFDSLDRSAVYLSRCLAAHVESQRTFRRNLSIEQDRTALRDASFIRIATI